MIVEFMFKLFRRERRHSIDITDICFFDIRPYMEQIRLGVPEICFTTHGRSNVFQTVRETVDERTTYKNGLYVNRCLKTRYRIYLALDSPNLANVISLLYVQ